MVDSGLGFPKQSSVFQRVDGSTCNIFYRKLHCIRNSDFDFFLTVTAGIIPENGGLVVSAADSS